jgi:hypothetical protein
MSLEELVSLDDLIAAFRTVLACRFPAAEWGALVIHQPDMPDTMIPVTPRFAPEPGSRLPAPPRQSS